MKRYLLGRSIWIEDGTLHVDARIFCQEQGYPPTTENQATVEEALREFCAKEWPGTSVTVLDRSELN